MSRLKEDKPQVTGEKVSAANDYEQLRRELLEMIRRNEELRRLKPK